MDRFLYLSSGLEYNETKIFQQKGARLYDGEDRTSYSDGSVILTQKRLIWRDDKVHIALPLNLVVFSEKHPGGLGKSAKVSMHLNAVPDMRSPGPVSRSRYDFVRVSFKDGGEAEFHRHLEVVIQKQAWKEEFSENAPINSPTQQQTKIRSAGIVGIERKIKEDIKLTEQNISVAFGDLTKLMEKAKEMVTLSSNIATKIKDKKGDITDDETVKFKSYLLSLGIPNPVTKETHGSGTHYHMQLAHEISKSLTKEVEISGGMMLLSDAFCRINRARGMELLSPDDMLNACKMLDNLSLPLKLRVFDSGVLVLQVSTLSDTLVIQQTRELVNESSSLSAQELANLVDVSVLLAKERLLLAESVGGICRDDSDEGLRFFPNLFLTMQS